MFTNATTEATMLKLTITDKMDWYSSEVRASFLYTDGRFDVVSYEQAQRTWSLENEATKSGYDGVYRWKVNGRPVPASFFHERLGGLNAAGEPNMVDLRYLLPAGQKAAEDAYVSSFLASYRSGRVGRPMSAEERAEISANFPKGTVVRNMVTGQETVA